MERRLSAILAADVVGYSRLLGEDETSTLSALREVRQDIFDPLASRFNGEIIKRMGDGWIVEFHSISDAAMCALTIQEKLADHALIKLRIGIHIGDVVFDTDDFFGDGVNVAARLEAAAAPGQVLISDTAYNSLDNKTKDRFRNGSEHQLKNISRPVTVYQWPVTDSPINSRRDVPKPVRDKPSIAIMPFINMSGDTEQAYFSDGITEDISTALSRLRWLIVIGKNSTAHLGEDELTPAEIGRQLGVGYVLEGSVRKAGNRIRVTTKLTDADNGEQIWAERLDRELEDIFELQDELTQAICAQVNSELADNEMSLARSKSAQDLRAWDLYQRGIWHAFKYTKDDTAEARRLFEESVRRAADFAPAYVGLSIVATAEHFVGTLQEDNEHLRQGVRDAEKAISIDDRDSLAYYALGRNLMLLGEGERAVAAYRKALDRNPNYAHAYYGLGLALYWTGRADQAIAYYAKSIHLSPNDPLLWSSYSMKSWAHCMLGELEQAIENANLAIQAKSDGFHAHYALACAAYYSGNIELAKQASERASQCQDRLNVSEFLKRVDTLHQPYLARVSESLLALQD